MEKALRYKVLTLLTLITLLDLLPPFTLFTLITRFFAAGAAVHWFNHQ